MACRVVEQIASVNRASDSGEPGRSILSLTELGFPARFPITAPSAGRRTTRRPHGGRPECAAEPLDPDRDIADRERQDYAGLNVLGRAQDQADAGLGALTATAEQRLHTLAHQGDRGASKLDARSSDVDNSAHSCR